MARFLRWLVNIILLCSIVVAAALLIPPLVGVTTVMVDEVGMDTNLPKGSVTYAKDIDLEKVAVGDKILVFDQEGQNIYRVKSLDSSDGSCILEDTKRAGSAETAKILHDKAAKAIITVPYIGYIPMAMKDTEGLIIIGLAVLLLIILFVLSELWREHEDEEEYDEESAYEHSGDEYYNIDRSFRIMEEAKSEIASGVSEAVSDEQSDEGDGFARTQRFDMTEDLETEMEEAYEQMAEDVPEEEMEDRKEDLKETRIFQMEEDQPEEAVEESLDEEMWNEDSIGEYDTRRLAMPSFTADELMEKAKKKGESPKVKKDDDSSVTILDYSDLL